MKKLYMLMVGLLIAIAANAADLYVVGGGNGMTWDLPGQKLSPNADGSYTLNVTNCAKFKVSTKYATEWDGDEGYNSGAFGPTGGVFTNAVFNSTGETVNCEPWGEDLMFPYTGAYTITISQDLSKMTVKANFAKPDGPTPVFIRGGMNNWGSPSNWQFDYDYSTNTYFLNCEINAGVEFKIADAGWGSINFGGSVSEFNKEITLAYNSNTNIKLSQKFVGTVYFTYSNGQGKAKFMETGAEPVYPQKMFILGEVNGNSWSASKGVEMTQTSKGIYTAKGVNITNASGYFSFSENLSTTDNWDELIRYGSSKSSDTEVVINTPMSISSGSVAFFAPKGTYDFTVNLVDMTMTVAGEVKEPDPMDKWYVTINGDYNNYNGDGIQSPNGIYNYTGLALGKGEFEVKVWNGVLDNFYGVDGKVVTLNQSAKLVAGAGHMTISGASEDEEFDVTVNLNDYTILVTKAGDEPVAPEFGVVGSMQPGDGWNLESPIEMTADGNVWTATFDTLAANTEFKIATIGKSWNDTYGAENEEPDGGNVVVTLGTPINAYTNCANNFVIGDKDLTDVKIVFNYIANPDDGPSTVTVTGTEDNGEEPGDETYSDAIATFNFESADDLESYYPGMLDDTAGWVADGSNSKYSINGKVATANENLSLTVATATGTQSPVIYKYSGKYDLRIYEGNTITLSAPDKGYISKIVFTCSTINSNINKLTLAAEQDLGDTQLVNNSSAKTMTWTGTEDLKPQSIIVTTTGNARIANVVVDYMIVTGVENIETEMANGPVEYYNLQGVRVANPDKGIYIVRQGGKAKKVIF